MTEPRERSGPARKSRDSTRQVFAFVVESGPNGFGAYAPDFPPSFAVGSTFEEALRAARDSLASQLRLIHGMGDPLPSAEPETAERIERASRTTKGAIVDADLRIVLQEVGPADAPPDAPSPPPAGKPAPPSRREVFAAVFANATDHWYAYIPDLPGGVSIADTFEETREDLKFGITDTLQRMTDLGEPIPEKRRPPGEALAYHHQPRTADESPGSAHPATVELMTFRVRPPRPAARMLKEMEEDAVDLRAKFETGRCRRRPLKPGASWTGRYAAIFEPSIFAFQAYVPDLPECWVEGKDRAETRKKLHQRLTVYLNRALSGEGTIPLPRRTRAQARTFRRRRTVEYGFDPDDQQGAHDTGMISVAIRAPYPNFL